MHECSVFYTVIFVAGGALLTEAEEECVHTHGVHAEEAVGNKVGTNHHRLRRETHSNHYYTQHRRLHSATFKA